MHTDNHNDSNKKITINISRNKVYIGIADPVWVDPDTDPTINKNRVWIRPSKNIPDPDSTITPGFPIHNPGYMVL